MHYSAAKHWNTLPSDICSVAGSKDFLKKDLANLFSRLIHFDLYLSVSATLRHWGNPARYSEKAPQKNGERANLALYFYKAACRLNPGIVF